MQNFLKGFVLMLSVFFLLNCSSSSSSSPDDPTPTTDEDLATFIKWVGHAWEFYGQKWCEKGRAGRVGDEGDPAPFWCDGSGTVVSELEHPDPLPRVCMMTHPLCGCTPSPGDASFQGGLRDEHAGKV